MVSVERARRNRPRPGWLFGVSVRACAALLAAAAVLASWAVGGERLRLATTTSTENSGLLAAILPAFEKLCACRVQVIAVGSGQAIALGERGDVDVVLVHARPLEERFVESGHGRERRAVMYNEFVIVGPRDDPAGVRSVGSAAAAFARIARARAAFLSRGDSSGTHVREKEIWQAAGVKPQGCWYLEVGRGMGETLMMADEKRGYTLADRGTVLAFGGKISLVVLLEGGQALRNDYSVIAVDPKRHPQVNYTGAMRFIAWITSAEGQRMIGEFGKDRFGVPLFHPVATEGVTSRSGQRGGRSAALYRGAGFAPAPFGLGGVAAG